MRVFTTADAARLMEGPVESATRKLSYLHSRGDLEKIRRGLWAVVPFGDDAAHPNPYLVGARLAGDQPYALLYHTALELHGVAHSPGDLVHVGVSQQLFAPFEYDGVAYRPRTMERWEAEWTVAVQVEGQEVRVTDREATLVHCAQCPHWSGGVEEVMRSVSVWPSIDAERVLAFTRRLGRKSAYNRVGFVLETFRQRWGVDPKTLKAFRVEACGRSPDYWGTEPGQDNQFDKRYQIVFPAILEALRGA